MIDLPSTSRWNYSILLTVSAAFLCIAISAAYPSQEKQKSPVDKVSFIHDVAPILQQNCFGCHDAKKKKGRLDMTTYAKFRKGGRYEDPIIAGNPAKSRLIELLDGPNDVRMPPPDAGPRLPKEQIELIARWIAQGAQLDAGIDPNMDLVRTLRQYWKPPALLTEYKQPTPITALAFSSDSRKIITSGYHELIVWDIASGKMEQRLHTRAERAHDLEVLPNGAVAVAGGRPGQEGDVRIYNLKSNSLPEKGVQILDGVNDKNVLIGELLQTNDEILTLDLSDDGKRLAAAGCDRTIRVWDISNGVKNARLEHSIENHADWVLSVNFAPNGRYLMTAGRDKSAKTWDLTKQESLVTFPGHNDTVWGAVMDISGKTGISAGADSQLRFWHAEEKSKQLGMQIRASAGHSDDILKLIDFRRGNKQILATCGADGKVILWDAANGKNIRTLEASKDHLYALAISPNGEWIAAGGYGGDVKIWRIADGSLITSFNASPGYSPVRGAN